MGAGGAAVAGSLGEGLQGYLGLQQQRRAAAADAKQQELWLKGQLGATTGPEMLTLIKAFGGQLTPERESALSSLDLVPSSVANQLLGILFKPSPGEGSTIPGSVLSSIIPPDLAKFYEGVDFAALSDLNLPASTVNAIIGALERLATSASQEGKSRVEVIPGDTVREITTILGLPVKENMTYPDIPVGSLSTFISTLADQTRPTEAATATGGNLAALTRFLMSGGKDVSALAEVTEIPPTWGTEVLSALTKSPAPTLEPTPEMRAKGITQPMTIDQFLRAMDLLQSTEEGPARIEPTPEMKTKGITRPVTLSEYQTFEDIFRPEQTVAISEDHPIAKHFPNLVGKEITADELDRLASVVEKVQRIQIGEAEAGRKALDWQREVEKNKRRRMPEEEATKIIKKLFPDFEPVMFPDEDGMVDWDEVMEDNKQLADLYRTSKDLLYLNYQIEDKQVDIALKRIDVDYKPKLYDSQLLLESGQRELNEARRSQVLQDMEFDAEYRPEEIREIRQRLKQGETMFDIELEKGRVQIENLRKEGKLLDAEIPYADDMAKTKAALMELNFKKLNQELEELPTAAIWAYFGVADPPKIKFYRYQISEALQFLNTKKNDVVTVEDVLKAMGMNTADRRLFSRDLLSSYINVDGGLISNIRQASQVDEITPANKIQLISELVQLVSPPLASNLNAGLIAVSNPTLAAQLMQPSIDVLKKISPELYNWAWKTINEVIQEATGIPVTAPSTPVSTTPKGTTPSPSTGNTAFEAWYTDSLKAVGSTQKILELIPKMDKAKLQQRLKEFGLKSVDELIALIKKKGGIK